jgi:hypothetical protein
MKTGIRTFGWALVVVAMLTAVVSGCEDNGLVAPTDSTLRVSANPATVVIDPNTQIPDPDTGRYTAETQLDAIVLDPNGFPMEGVSLVFRSSAGTLTSGGAAIETNGSGVASDILTVTDLSPNSITVEALSGNQEGSTTVTVVVVGQNIPPVASLTATPSPSGRVGEQVTFDGSASSDPDGAITCFKWRITTNDPASPPEQYYQGAIRDTIRRTYDVEQTLGVDLWVSDLTGDGPDNTCQTCDATNSGDACLVDDALFAGRDNIISYVIDCPNARPVARMIPSGATDVTIDVDNGYATLIIDGSLSSDEETASQDLEYFWKCQPAEGTQGGLGVDSVTCTYNTAGLYTATLYVTDLGTADCPRESSDVEELSVVVSNPVGTP